MRMLLGVIVLVLGIASSALAQTPTLPGLKFSLGPFTENTGAAVTAYAKDFGKGSAARVATGLCGGTLFRVTNQGKWLADLITLCGLGATTVQGEASPTALIGGELINLMGLRLGVYYNTETKPSGANWAEHFTWTIGVNLLAGATNLAR